jgi:voltage-gated potassium channel
MPFAKSMSLVTSDHFIPADPAADELRFGEHTPGWRRTLFTVIFESETRARLLFDLV